MNEHGDDVNRETAEPARLEAGRVPGFVPDYGMAPGWVISV